MIREIRQAPETAPRLNAESQKRRLKEACEEFESLMTNYMLKGMRESVVRAEEPDQATAIYESMLDEQISKDMAKSQQKGLSEILYQQLSKLIKEAPSKPEADGAKP